ncbi:MAG: hypothetical protein IPG61_18085 [bacterium]|nr:hypothetical protein [bacterium]
MGRTAAAFPVLDESTHTMARTAWLIDGMAYVFRSFFGMRPMAAPDGTPINAVFGLGMTLQKFLVERKPELLACCFDAGAQTFRNELYPAYKANRGEPPADLIPQFDICRELVAHMGIATVTVPGFEADDLIATPDGTTARRGALRWSSSRATRTWRSSCGPACASTTWRATCGGTPTTCRTAWVCGRNRSSTCWR